MIDTHRIWLRRALGICAVAGAAAAAAVGPAFATQPNSNDNLVEGPYVENGHMVTICHRTGADDKFVVITVDVAAINGGEASDHDNHNQVGNGPDGDVIPPVAGYNDDGKNWNDNWAPGQTVTEALCVGGSSS